MNMNEVVLIVSNNSYWFLEATVGLLIGVIAGYIFFRSLRSSVHHYLSGSYTSAVVGHFVRFGVLIPVLILLAQWGGIALIAGVIGVTLARQLLVRSVRQEA